MTSAAGLATAYRIGGRYTQAEVPLNKTLESQRRVWGEEHPDTLESRAGPFSPARGIIHFGVPANDGGRISFAAPN